MSTLTLLAHRPETRHAALLEAQPEFKLCLHTATHTGNVLALLLAKEFSARTGRLGGQGGGPAHPEATLVAQIEQHEHVRTKIQ